MNQRIEEIEKRLKAASTEIWTWYPTGMAPERMASLNILHSHNHTPYVSIEKAEFIAHSPADVAYLLEKLKKAVEVIERLGSSSAFGYPGKIDPELELRITYARDLLKELGSNG